MRRAGRSGWERAAWEPSKLFFASPSPNYWKPFFGFCHWRSRSTRGPRLLAPTVEGPGYEIQGRTLLGSGGNERSGLLGVTTIYERNFLDAALYFLDSLGLGFRDLPSVPPGATTGCHPGLQAGDWPPWEQSSTCARPPRSLGVLLRVCSNLYCSECVLPGPAGLAVGVGGCLTCDRATVILTEAPLFGAAWVAKGGFNFPQMCRLAVKGISHFYPPLHKEEVKKQVTVGWN